MRLAGLSFEQAPPITVPLRFFLSAPLFLIMAALLLFWQGPLIFTSRWLPATLALTHLMTLGFMTQVMLGALMQVLPVVVGVPVPRPRLTAALIQIPLVGGTLLLAGGFLHGGAVWFQSALLLLGGSLGFASVILLICLWRAPSSGPTPIALRLAVIGLLLTLLLGLALGSYFGWNLPLPIVSLTDLHLAWGLLGWTVCLVAGVAYQVVPMFQITAPYPPTLTCLLVPGLALLLLCHSVLVLAGVSPTRPWPNITSGLMAGGLILFAATTLYLLAHRRRKLADTTLRCWQLSMSSLLACAALWLAAMFLPNLAQAPAFPLLLAVFMLVGFVLSAITGMLYKIVPFLVWFHLQAQLWRSNPISNMKQVLAGRIMYGQVRVHIVTLLLLLGAALQPAWFTYPAALALGLSGAWLEYNLISAWRLYRRYAGIPLAAPASQLRLY